MAPDTFSPVLCINGWVPRLSLIDSFGAAEVYTFTPPADSVDASDPRDCCGISIGRGSGGSFPGPGGKAASSIDTRMNGWAIP